MPLKLAPPEEPTLNLTPMIDVILTLVIFFMVATKFTDEEKALGLKVPSVSNQSATSVTAVEPKVVNVYS
ncbi:MAG TPA: biopolymer transporter ExbD, partial [Pirellulales bacterium]